MIENSLSLFFAPRFRWRCLETTDQRKASDELRSCNEQGEIVQALAWTWWPRPHFVVRNSVCGVLPSWCALFFFELGSTQAP